MHKALHTEMTQATLTLEDTALSHFPPLPSTSHIQHTRCNQNSNVWEGGDSLVRKRGEGDREKREVERERGREGEEGQSKYKLFCTSA